MKTASFTALAAALTLCLAGGASAHPGAPHTDASSSTFSAEAQAASQAVNDFHAALARGDAAAGAALLDDMASIFEEGGAEQTKAAYVAGHLPADIAYLKDVRNVIVARTGAAAGGLAWIATQGRAQGHYHDKAVDRDTTETMVLRRTPQGWRIVHIHWSSHAAKPAAS